MVIRGHLRPRRARSVRRGASGPTGPPLAPLRDNTRNRTSSVYPGDRLTRKAIVPAAEELYDILRNRFSLQEFRAGQREAIETVLAGHDALVIMPTGSGKSLIYQLPALLLPGLTVVVSPLIALMKDQTDKLEE